MSGWLGVVSAAHVRRGVELGFAQLGHGRRSGLAKLKQGDTLVYYSPVETLGDRKPLQEFTALGVIEDDEVWQADEGDFHPFRRRVRYEHCLPVSLDAVRPQLHLTTAPNWGYQLRRGLIALDEHDVAALREAMLP